MAREGLKAAGRVQGSPRRRTGLLAAALALLLLATPQAPCASRMPDRPPLRVVASQMVMAGFRGLSVEASSVVGKWIAREALGGVILFDRDLSRGPSQRNIESPEQVRRLTAELQEGSRLPLLVAVDQEGGEVARLGPQHGFPAFPSAASLGRRDDPTTTRGSARRLGRTLARAGINLYLAPVVDLEVTPNSPAIGKLDRSFGRDPRLVSEQAEAFVQGLHQAGVLACLKHFPGHGSATGDTHQGLVDITRTWTPAELLPYETLIGSGYRDPVMAGHLINRSLDPNAPATLSEPVIRGLLRRELGFDGVVLTDDLQMQAITGHFSLKETVLGAVRAGADILLFGNNLEYDPAIASKAKRILLRAVERGLLTEHRLRRSYRRIKVLKDRLASHPALSCGRFSR